ncbi:MAG: zf-HC2 domain-containing protein [Pyrinomonadaceae bacterium]
MSIDLEKNMNCSEFEELLSDYLDKSLNNQINKAVAAHALQCPICHSLLNEVKGALEICHEISAPKTPMTRLEARVLSMTMPESAMHCGDFEEHLTDYLDGFLPAGLFHRWERHAVLCTECTDLPGAVVRSIAACYTYKMDELELPDGLNARILSATLGTPEAVSVTASWSDRIGEWLRGLSLPIPIPQLAPVAMMVLFAFMIFSQTVSADGSLTDVYNKSFELAEQTYRQSADAWNGISPEQQISNQNPVTGTTYVNQGENNK